MRNFAALSLAVVLVAACGRQQNLPGGNNTTTDAGPGTGTDAGQSLYTVTTVENLWANLASLSGGGIEIDGAIVVASNTYTSESSKCTTNKQVQTFYIQDPAGGAGVAVYDACTDLGNDYPNIGDIVKVQGYVAKYDGSLQISAYSKDNIALNISVTTAGGGDGKAMSGAYPPAGTPTNVTADPSEYAYSAPNPHPEQLGTALHFDDVSITVQDPAYFTFTSADGGTVDPEGFQITGGIWVDDSNVYSTCIKPLGLDGGILPLPSGVTGMWDKYQDYYGHNPDGGYADIYPVLVLEQCSDLGLGAPDAG